MASPNKTQDDVAALEKGPDEPSMDASVPPRLSDHEVCFLGAPL